MSLGTERGQALFWGEAMGEGGSQWVGRLGRREIFDSEDGWQSEVVFGAGRRGTRSFLKVGGMKKRGTWRACLCTRGQGRSGPKPRA